MHSAHTQNKHTEAHIPHQFILWLINKCALFRYTKNYLTVYSFNLLDQIKERNVTNQKK